MHSKIFALGGVILLGLTAPASISGQSLVEDDYKIFGRKRPLSLGSAFNTIGRFSPYENPADLAFVADNSIAIDFVSAFQGIGQQLSFTGPNFSLSNATQTLKNENDIDHIKELLQFSIGLSFGDGAPLEGNALAFGFSLSRKSDELLDTLNTMSKFMTADFGAIYKMGRSQFAVTVHNLVVIGDDGYPLMFTLGYRTTTAFGMRVAIEGLPGTGYGPSGATSFGMRLGLAQSFFNGRLHSRMQLETFFDDSGTATMQSLTGGVGYRMKPGGATNILTPLLDTEFGYALNFLATPNVIGTHILSLTKYF